LLLFGSLLMVPSVFCFCSSLVSEDICHAYKGWSGGGVCWAVDSAVKRTVSLKGGCRLQRGSSTGRVLQRVVVRQ
jgi:hypothetical protein